jgi:hypothetical protein
LEKSELIEKGRPGSPCPKKFVAMNKDFLDTGICTASRQYQHLKIMELEKQELSNEDYTYYYNKITEKSCTCVGLGTSALLTYGLDTKTEGEGVSVCPGPNMAYFSKTMELSEMIDHIYGRTNVITREDRPHMFIKELHIYLDYLATRIGETRFSPTDKQRKYLLTFASNLNDGIDYYQALFNNLKEEFSGSKQQILELLDEGRKTLISLVQEIESLENNLAIQ